MKHIVWGDATFQPEWNRAFSDWLAPRIEPAGRFQPPFVTMAIFEDSDLQGVMLFNNWSEETGVIEIHGASTTPHWLTREVLWAMFSYPFNQLRCQSVVMRVDPDNRRLARILRSYGFKSHLIPRLRGRDKDELIFILHDDDWRMNGFHKENLIDG